MNANGLTLTDCTSLNGLGGFSGSIKLDNGIVYGASGGIINPSTTPPLQIATMSRPDFYQEGISPWGVSVVPDASTQKAFLMLENTAGTWAYGLARYDTTHYLPEAWLTMPPALRQLGRCCAGDRVDWRCYQQPIPRSTVKQLHNFFCYEAPSSLRSYWRPIQRPV